MRSFLCCVVLVVTAACPAAEPPTVYRKVAVAADHPAASDAGLEVWQAGGNVVDVAAAVGFALSVVRPESSGIGGGGFMVVWNAEQRRAVAIDYRERAPAAATPDMFLRPDGTPDPDASRFGAKAVAVPHHVAGLCYAVRTYGRLELQKVLAPAIRLAKQGVPLDATGMKARRETLRRFAEHPEWKHRFAAFHHLYLEEGRTPEVGQVFKSPQAALLERIAAEGPAGFYSGPAAEAFVAEMRRDGGLITLDDLKQARAIERPPLTSPYFGGTLVTMPPPSSGGIALIEMLNILDAYGRTHPADAAALADRNSPRFRHVLAEAMKHAFADRATYLGDPEAAEIPTAALISPEYAATLAAKIDPASTKPLDAYGRTLPTTDAGTTHFSVIDADGNGVACTETVNLTFGSYVVVPETGLLLNDEMDDFAARPGTPNAFGLVQSEAAAIGPGRRPLSSMTPTLLVRDGKAVLAVGASGGPRIITATLQVLLNRVRFGLPVADAVAAPRQHHQWLPNRLLLEPQLRKTSAGPLGALGHEIETNQSLAVSQLVVRTPDGLEAACDPRKGGRPAGE